MDNRIEKTIRLVIELLVNGEYEKLAEITGNSRLSADDIRECVKQYPGTLIMPPDRTFNDLDVIETTKPPPTEWSVRFDLWTREEGLSDLSLEMALTDCDDEFLIIRLDNIHVL